MSSNRSVLWDAFLASKVLNAVKIPQSDSGSIVDIDNDYPRPLSSLISAIDPVQALHGYNAPWPPGGGKNLFHNTAASTTKNEVTFTVNDDGSVALSGTATAETDLVLAVIAADALPKNTGLIVSGGYSSNIFFRCGIDGSTPTSRGGDVAVTTTDGAFTGNCYIRVANGTNCNGVTIYPMIRLASVTDPTFAPYSNICPITGHDSVDVVRTGKNLFPTSRIELGKTVGEGARTINVYADILAGDYIFSFDNIGTYTGTSYSIQAFAGASMVTQMNKDTKLLSLQQPIDRFYIYFPTSSYNNGETFILDNVQLELGSTATSYEPYAGTTIPVNFGAAGTVYGGTVDVVSGVLTVTHGVIASYNGETLPGTWISDRDAYAPGATPTMGAQVVYELAEPLTYQLTPTEVELLVGKNTIYSDTGDVTVEYSTESVPRGEWPMVMNRWFDVEYPLAALFAKIGD